MTERPNAMERHVVRLPRRTERRGPSFSRVGPLFVAAMLIGAICFGGPWTAAGLGARNAAAQEDVLRIAAVVNDDVISVFDLALKLAVAIRSSGFNDSPELRRQLAPQVLRAMIDERLQAQEAKRLKIEVTKTELDGAIAQIEKQNRWEPGTFSQRLADTRVDQNAILDQIRTEIAWGKMVRRKFVATLNIGEDEVDEAIRRIEANRGKTEYKIAEIFIPVEESGDEEEARAVSTDLVRQLRAGSSFAAAARQFSKSASASEGGEVGWVVGGQLVNEIDVVLKTLRPGQISDPIRTFDGFYIISLSDERTVLGGGVGSSTFRLAQVVLDPSSGDAGQVQSLVKKLKATKNCESFLAAARGHSAPISGEIGRVALDDLPTDIKAAVVSLTDGQVTDPLPFEGSRRLIMVCERTFAEAPSAGPIDRESVRRDLSNRRLDLAARRYLRDLRRGAFIEVRI